MTEMLRHAYSPKAHADRCGVCGGKSYDAVHAPTEQEYRRRKTEAARHERQQVQAWRPAPVPSSSKCKNCGYDLRGMYGSDRQAHKDGWCRD
jgi:rubredoxin